MPQLADVARPRVPFERRNGVRREPQRTALVARRRLAQERAREQRNVAAALAQRRQSEGQHAQPVIQVFAKLAATYFGLEPRVG